MDLLIPDKLLRQFLETKASPKEIAKYLSLCGPSIEKISSSDSGPVYHVEVTTNRIDAASAYGLAREATAILPRFGIPAKLKPLNLTEKKIGKNLDFKISDDPGLNRRTTCVLLGNIQIKESPTEIKNLLSAVGQRSLNSAVDITNFVMWALGHPIHAFDYDRLTNKKIVVREAKKGEHLISLDGKNHTLHGGEVIFDDGTGQIIDLPGIMGTKNSVVDEKTKNILLWIESIDPIRVRKASMRHGIRTQAAKLNEKNVDPELAKTALLFAIKLYEKIVGAKQISDIVDVYPKPYKEKAVIVSKEFLTKRIGIEIPRVDIDKYLTALGFMPSWKGDELRVGIPSHRAGDVSIPEDIVEEVARIYGYRNIPSKIMDGEVPEPPSGLSFLLESKIRDLLFAASANEVYTLPLVAESEAPNGLKIKNPLGDDTSVLRTSLLPSLQGAVKDNSFETEKFHLYEIANVYIPKKGNLPDEKLMLAGIFSGYDYREAKGVLEMLIAHLGIKWDFKIADQTKFVAGQALYSSKLNAAFGVLPTGDIYYEIPILKLMLNYQPTRSYKPLAKYPAQHEDLTLILPEKTRVADVITVAKKASEWVAEVTLKDIYKDAYTFSISYQSTSKTLDNKEVESIREVLLANLANKLAVRLKE